MIPIYWVFEVAIFLEYVVRLVEWMICTNLL
jgi:hypothetical protein